MEAKRLEDLNAAASAEGADDETKARYDNDTMRYDAIPQMYIWRVYTITPLVFTMNFKLPATAVVSFRVLRKS